jgi:hypothetical protein
MTVCYGIKTVIVAKIQYTRFATGNINRIDERKYRVPITALLSVESVSSSSLL